MAWASSALSSHDAAAERRTSRAPTLCRGGRPRLARTSEFRYDNPDDVLAQLASQERAYVRLAATRVDDGWKQTLLEIVTGPPPPHWEPIEWTYPASLFVARAVTGSTAAEWLTNGVARVGELEVVLPPLNERLLVERYASKVFRSYEPLLWPNVMVELTAGPVATGPPIGALIGDNAPTFLNFLLAARYFLGLMESASSGFDHYLPTLRFQDCTARIVNVLVESAEVEIEVEVGDEQEARNLRIDLASDVPGSLERLGRRTKVRIPLRDGLPPGAWVLIRRGTEWLDRRFIDPRHGYQGAEGVEFAVEPHTEVETLASSGESETVEFKQELPTDKDARRNVARSVAAFANGAGGTILFGVGPHSEIVGVPITGRREPTVDISNVVKDSVNPRPKFHVSVVPLDEIARTAPRDNGGAELGVVVLRVEAGTDRPYGVGDPLAI
jgi:hypothetical protein